jgi:hypothetical protein
LKDSTIELQSVLDQFKFEQRALALTVQIEIPNLVTIQRVTAEGQLVSLDSKLLKFFVKESATGLAFEINNVHLVGEVIAGKLHARCSFESSFGKAEQVLEPIELASGSILNSLQPMAKMRVWPGQHWKITNVDPLMEAVKASIGQIIGELLSGSKKGGVKIASLQLPVSAPTVISAEVLAEPRELIHQDGKSISCYVIEYHSGDFSGSTWVQSDTGKVLLQEATHEKDKIVLRRED